MNDAVARKILQEQTVPSLRGSGGDGHADAIECLLAENKRLRAALRDCAQIADDATHAGMTDEERDIATTIRNLILSRYPESRKALKGEEGK